MVSFPDKENIVALRSESRPRRMYIGKPTALKRLPHSCDETLMRLHMIRNPFIHTQALYVTKLITRRFELS